MKDDGVTDPEVHTLDAELMDTTTGNIPKPDVGMKRMTVRNDLLVTYGYTDGGSGM